MRPDVVQQRISGARRLRGKSQADLNRALAAYGFPVKEAGELERGDKTLQPKHVQPLAQILDVPERWFTDDELDLATTPGPAVWREALEQARANGDMMMQMLEAQAHSGHELVNHATAIVIAALNERIGKVLDRLDEREAASRPPAADVPPAPAGELARWTEGSLPSGEDRRRGERRRARNGS